MKQIYVVTAGEYSDYRIEAIFSSREDADVYAENYNRAGNWSNSSVEEWEVDATKPRPGWLQWLVTIDPKTNNATRAYTGGSGPIGFSTTIDGGINVVLDADSEERAIKAAKEKYFQAKAAGTLPALR